jgi:steroid 5-alpha reductase family enzyme
MQYTFAMETVLQYGQALAITLFGVWVYMMLGFLYSLKTKRVDIVDVLWGVGFVFVAVTTLARFNTLPSVRQLVVLVLVAIWGIRLASHIYKRNKNKPEDYRYAAWRSAWGRWFNLRAFFQVFLLQGVLMVLVASPIIFINRFDGSFLDVLNIDFYLVAGLLVWAVGFYFESRGDAQLKAFLGNPENKGKIMMSGLWAYTRHPNYFGEVTQWWGIFVIALGLPMGWLALLGPLTITLLILKVSGIPMLEKKYAGNPEFESYKKRTSAFFPLPPRRSTN